MVPDPRIKFIDQGLQVLDDSPKKSVKLQLATRKSKMAKPMLQAGVPLNKIDKIDATSFSDYHTKTDQIFRDEWSINI
jgi:hypothetical protein